MLCEGGGCAFGEVWEVTRSVCPFFFYSFAKGVGMQEGIMKASADRNEC